MEQTIFNPAQKRILHMLSFINTPKELTLMRMFFQSILQRKFMRKWTSSASGTITLDTIESWNNEHLRKSYR